MVVLACMKPRANLTFIIHVHVLTSDQQWRNTGFLQFYMTDVIAASMLTSIGATNAVYKCTVFSSPLSPPWVPQLMVPTTVVHTQAHNLKLTRWILVWSCYLTQSYLGSSSPDCYLQGLHLSRRAADLTYEGNMNDFTAKFLWVLCDQTSSRIDKWSAFF